jgi:hypothetical protein
MIATVFGKSGSTEEFSMPENPRVLVRYSNPETISRYGWFGSVFCIRLALKADKTTVFCISAYLAVSVLAMLLQ